MAENTAKHRSAWGEFLRARHELIHEWHEQGIPGVDGKATPELIAEHLNHHDPGQIRLLIATPLEG